MAVVSSLFAFFLGISSIVNLVRFLAWFKKPRIKGVATKLLDKSRGFSPYNKKDLYTYELKDEDAPDSEPYALSVKVLQGKDPEVMLNTPFEVIVNKEEKTALRIEDLQLIKKNLYRYPLMCLASIGITIALVIIGSLL